MSGFVTEHPAWRRWRRAARPGRRGARPVPQAPRPRSGSPTPRPWLSGKHAATDAARAGRQPPPRARAEPSRPLSARHLPAPDRGAPAHRRRRDRRCSRSICADVEAKAIARERELREITAPQRHHARRGRQQSSGACCSTFADAGRQGAGRTCVPPPASEWPHTVDALARSPTSRPSVSVFDLTPLEPRRARSARPAHRDRHAAARAG